MGKDSGTLYDGSSSKYWWYELIKGFFWWCGIRVSVHRVAFMCVAEIPNFSFVTEELILVTDLLWSFLLLYSPETVVAHKTITKAPTFVKSVSKFRNATNPIYDLSLCGPHNHYWEG